MKWFRFYSQVLHDSKVQTLSRELFWAWVNLLCVANEEEDRGTLPGLKRIAFALRVTERKALHYLDMLKAVGLLDQDADGTIRPHDWEQWQYDSESSNERVKRYRARIRAKGETVTGYTYHRAAVNLRDGHACVYCLATDKLVLDHLVPIQRGGDGEPDNLVTACKACNSGKSGRLIEECGYVIRRAETVAQYAAVKSRLGVTVKSHPVTPVTVTVTPPVTVNVTDMSLRARSETETDTDTDSDPPYGGRQSPAGEAAAAVDEARVRFGDKIASMMRDNAVDIAETLGDRFDLYLAALERSRNYSKPIADLHRFAISLALRYARTGIPPDPVAIEPAAAPARESATERRTRERKAQVAAMKARDRAESERGACNGDA